jgi:hypothetical protein
LSFVEVGDTVRLVASCANATKSGGFGKPVDFSAATMIEIDLFELLGRGALRIV